MPHDSLPPAAGKGRMLLAVGALAVIAVAGFFLVGGKTGGMVISVAGPGGTAVEGVSVLLDDKEVCKTSICKVSDLAPGSYVVRAKAEGYAEMAGTAYKIEGGEEKAINIELTGTDGGTGLKVTSEAPGLTLSIDGKRIGALPQEVSDIEPGEHKLTLSGSLFIDEYSETVTVKKGETLEFEPKLKLSKGQVNIKLDDSAQGAKIVLLVNGKRRSLSSRFGEDGEKSVKIDLPLEGKVYVVRALKKGFETFEEELKFSLKEPVQTVTILLTPEGADEDDDASRSASAPATSPRPSSARSPSPSPSPAASASQGKLNINSIPKSNVILDGRPIGSTPKIGYSVSAGSHTVVFVHPEHGRKVKSVSVTAGGVGTAAVRFP